MRLLQQKGGSISTNIGTVPYSPSSEQTATSLSDISTFSNYNYQQSSNVRHTQSPTTSPVVPVVNQSNTKKREIEASGTTTTIATPMNKKSKEGNNNGTSESSVVTQVTTSYSQGRFCLVEHPSVRQRKCYKGENRYF